MKFNNLYWILLLIVIIFFTCVSSKDKLNIFEGFALSQPNNNNNNDNTSTNDVVTFDKDCIKSCKNEADKLGLSNYKKRCKKSCDKIAEQCQYDPLNSLEWWQCLHNINPNINIPQYLQEELNNQDNDPDNNQHQDNQHQDNQHPNNQHSNNQHPNNQQPNNQQPNNNQQNPFDANPNFGIPRHQIPRGDEDLYILRSQIVPPVCPACPTLNCGDCKTEAPPCPPCARCPEPSFECKKVPNFSAAKANDMLPIPWLNDFSQFGQ